MEAQAREGAPRLDVRALAVCASAASFALYASRLCPTLCLDGDSAELVTAATVWGVPHAPGYALFTALAHAFTWIPLHALPWRVHLTSAVFHAGTVGATVLSTFAITKDRAAALAAGVALAFERSFLLGSLYAEVFPLNDLLFAWLLFLALALRHRSRAASPLAFAAVAGVAAAHHMMIALAAPTLALLALPAIAERRPAARGWASLAVAFVAPSVAGWGLVLLAASRDPALSWGDVHDARSLFALVTRSDYGGLLSAVHGAGHGTGLERVVALGGLLAGGFGVMTLLLAAVGAVDLVRRERIVGIGLVVGALASGPLFAWLNALGTDSEEALAFFERFSTMCTIPIAIAFGAGVGLLGRALGRMRSRPLRVAGALALAGWAALAFARVRGVDRSHDDRGIAFAHDLILPTPDRSLVLLSGDAPANAALYVCAVEGRCGSRIALSPGSLFMPWAMAQARRRHPDLTIPWEAGRALRKTHELAAAEATTRAVFVYPDLLEKDPLLVETFTPLPDHLLFRLWPHDAAPEVARAALLASARAIGTGRAPGSARTECEGCDLPPPGDHPTQEMQLVLAYEAAAYNHARAVAPLELPEGRALLPALLARAGDYAQRGGASMSRKSSSSSR
jgi:hypothetical protein